MKTPWALYDGVAQRLTDWYDLPGQHEQGKWQPPSAEAHRLRLQIRNVRRFINGAFDLLGSSLSLVHHFLWRRVENLGQIVAFQPFEAVVDDTDSADVLAGFSDGDILAEKDVLTW